MSNFKGHSAETRPVGGQTAGGVPTRHHSSKVTPLIGHSAGGTSVSGHPVGRTV